MCEACDRKSRSWQGWMELPAPRACRPTAGWCDLSHPAHAGMPRIKSFPEPAFPRLKSMPDNPFNVTGIDMAVHTGTHVDAPLHFVADGPAVDGIPLERLTGAGLVWHVRTTPGAVITVADLKDLQPALLPGDILALYTGWSEKAGTDAYDHHPSLGVDAAEWLIAQRCKLLAVDFGTPDLAPAARPTGFDFPVHNTLLPRGVLICEHLTGHAALAGRRVEFVFNGLNIRGSDGTPTRVLARPIEDLS